MQTQLLPVEGGFRVKNDLVVMVHSGGCLMTFYFTAYNDDLQGSISAHT